MNVFAVLLRALPSPGVWLTSSELNLGKCSLAASLKLHSALRLQLDDNNGDLSNASLSGWSLRSYSNANFIPHQCADTDLSSLTLQEAKACICALIWIPIRTLAIVVPAMPPLCREEKWLKHNLSLGDVQLLGAKARQSS